MPTRVVVNKIELPGAEENADVLREYYGGDYPIVAVNSDEDMIRKKGYCFMPLAERMEIVSSLKWVDEVVPVIDNDGSCAKTLRKLRPTIFARGGDRRPDINPIPDIEIEACRDIECRIIYGVGDEKVQSSSGLVANVRR